MIDTSNNLRCEFQQLYFMDGVERQLTWQQMWLEIITSINCKSNLQSGHSVLFLTLVLTFIKTISNQQRLGELIPHLLQYQNRGASYYIGLSSYTIKFSK